MSPTNYTKDFSLDPAHTWLNVASEGPLPKAAKKALEEAVVWKSSPHLLTVAKFQQAPLELKQSIARLIHVHHDDVILGNSATYGLHLLANGLPLKAGDEIILLQNDFPTDILPWLSLESKGVIVHQLKAQHHVLTPEELKKAINRQTKLVCLPLVHSFTGFKQELTLISQLCRSHGIRCIVNLSQAAGAFEIDLNEWEVDAAVCAGYKWLLGPYGTGFCWIKKEVREKLNYAQNYWISLMDEKSLSSEGPLSLKDDHSARRYDIFGTANFFNYVPWRASIDYLLSVGLNKINEHNQRLVDQLISGLDQKKFYLVSPSAKKERSNIVVFSYQDAFQNSRLSEFLKSEGIHLALWKNRLRASPHLYNTSQDIEKLLKALEGYGQ